jgi:hypothetical protein
MLSRIQLFVEKVRDVVGLYLNPPDKAVVLSVDEKTGIQALDPTQPILPMRPGQGERRTRDYVRDGITDLFAALNLATGQVSTPVAAPAPSRVPEAPGGPPPRRSWGIGRPQVVLARPRFMLYITRTRSSWLQPGRAMVRRADPPAPSSFGPQVGQAMTADLRLPDRPMERGPNAVRLHKTADDILET